MSRDAHARRDTVAICYKRVAGSNALVEHAWDRSMVLGVEPGTIDVMVGSSSADIRLTGSFEIVGETTRVEGRRAYSSCVFTNA